MPISDLFKLHDPALAEQFNVQPYKADKDRKAFIKSLNATIGQLNSGNTKVPNRMWSAANDIVELKPTFKGRPITIMGESTFYIPQNHFAEAIKTITDAVEAGELDSELEGVQGGEGGTPAPTKAKSTRSFSDESKLNIRVGGFRRGGKSDAEIKKLLTEEGVAKEAIDKAIAKKPAAKK